MTTMVILFGGGDGGGLIISSTGVRPIPPFDPGLRFQLRGVSSLVQAMERLPSADEQRKLAPILQKLTHFAIDEVEQVVGPLHPDHAIIYQDGDGGFTCGSTGKLPVPLKWPPPGVPNLSDVIAHGFFRADLTELLNTAHARGASLIEAFEEPESVANKLEDEELPPTGADAGPVLPAHRRSPALQIITDR